MKRLLLILALCLPASAQLWSGVIDSSRAIDWTQAGVQGGIPTNITVQCGSTIAAYGSSGSYASPATINNAIAACTPGDFVQLGTGDFYLNAGLAWAGTSGVVVRGNGANNTKIHFSNINTCGGLGAVACMSDSSPVYQDSTVVQPGNTQAANWTGGYTVGATSITVGSVGSTGIVNGQWIFLDQNMAEVFGSLTESGSTATFTAAGKLPNTFINGATLRLFNASVAGYDTVTATLSNVNQSAGTFQYTAGTSSMGAATGAVAVVDNGSLVICEVYQLCGYAGAAAASDGVGRNVNGSRRMPWQAVKVTAGCSSPCSGTGPFTLTISPGLYLAADTNMSPGAWWPTAQVTADGIEDLLLDQTNNSGGNSGTGGIVMYDCFGCWAKGVAETDAWLNHVWIFQSAQNTVESCYFYGTQSGGGIESYGVESYLASNNLVQNTIFQQISAPTMAGPSEGTVYAYNYSINDPSGAATIMSAMNWVTHDIQQDSLFEGNIGPGFRADSTFANGDFNTAFRNRYTGQDYGDGQLKTGYTYPVGLEFWNRFYNVIGNILGTPSYHTTYETSVNTCGGSCSGSTASVSVYVLGFSGAGTQQCANPTYCPNDSLVNTTLMRWGNYDVVNAANEFNSGEVPSGLAKYSNAVPATHTLPPSFYLNITAKPSCGTGLTWWKLPGGTCPPFPPIGPDVSSGNLGYTPSGAATGLPCSTANGSCMQVAGGEAYLTPAMNCYLNVMSGPLNGTGNALSFNRTSCYSNDPVSSAVLVTITGILKGAVIQ